MDDRSGNFFQFVLTAALVAAAFWVGTLYMQVKILREGGVKVAGVQEQKTEDDALDPEVEKQLVLDEALWQELLDKPAAALGQDSATVTMVEFSDYQCPYCERAFKENWPKIKQDYVDAGKVKYVFRDYPLPGHFNAKPAALAARCAGEQKKYVEIHDKLFSTQAEWADLADPKEKFVAYAKELGLSSSKFTSCYDGKKYEKEIEADLALAAKVNTNATPTFFINGKQIVGAQPVSVFTKALDEALN